MTETVLLVGGGGREHAVARALADDVELYACASNRNPGIARLAAGFSEVDERDTAAVVSYATSVDADLAVIGPESALAAGVADALADAGVYTFGPSADAARIETDKQFQRSFMREQAIPGCPEFETFDDSEAAASYVAAVEHDVAVKPAGLTGGKGVRVTGDQLTREEAVSYVRESTYDEWVIEERLIGEEFTVQAFVADGEVRPTPAVQDHKRAYEGDEGPNTGGMGSYSAPERTLPFLSDADYERAVEILEATVDALPAYEGVLYGQFMATADGVAVVEFNARFGDPEATNTLPVMETPLIDVLTAARDGEPLPELSFAPTATVCKYAVPEGYPTDPAGGTKIEIDESSAGDALLFYASVDERADGLYTTTSRAMAVVGTGSTISEAETVASDALAAAGEGLRYRTDVGTAALVEQRVDHVTELRGEG
ncbi:MAG: phosphoribosylamine--glycine ligase [Halobaculum sp.]